MPVSYYRIGASVQQHHHEPTLSGLLLAQLSDVTREAEQWRRALFTELEWKRAPTERGLKVQPGEAGGWLVEAAGSQFWAYLKPSRKCGPTQPRSANEKIVSDLAFDLSFPVPPVLLYRRNDAGPDEETRACLSLIVADEFWRLQQIEAIRLAPGNDQLDVELRRAMASASAMVALDTWIGNTDRNNGGNIVWCAVHGPPAHNRFMFIDHAFSLNNEAVWERDPNRPVQAVDLHAFFLANVDWDKVFEGVESIERFPDSGIEGIVGRVPDDYMSADHRRAVIECLKKRRHQLRPSLTALRTRQ